MRANRNVASVPEATQDSLAKNRVLTSAHEQYGDILGFSSVDFYGAVLGPERLPLGETVKLRLCGPENVTRASQDMVGCLKSQF